MISTSNLTIQFGPKPLFENIGIKFSDGNRYGLIGANGSKSTFMKIIGGDLEPAGSSCGSYGLRLGKLRQGQFAFERAYGAGCGDDGTHRNVASDARRKRDAIYMNPEATDDDYMRAAELEAKVAEYDGYGGSTCF